MLQLDRVKGLARMIEDAIAFKYLARPLTDADCRTGAIDRNPEGTSRRASTKGRRAELKAQGMRAAGRYREDAGHRPGGHYVEGDALAAGWCTGE